jgi:hypothetical protein
MIAMSKIAFCTISAHARQKPCTHCRLMADVHFLQLGLVMRERAMRIGAFSSGRQICAHPGLLQIWGLHKLT